MTVPMRLAAITAMVFVLSSCALVEPTPQPAPVALTRVTPRIVERDLSAAPKRPVATPN